MEVTGVVTFVASSLIVTVAQLTSAQYASKDEPASVSDALMMSALTMMNLPLKQSA